MPLVVRSNKGIERTASGRINQHGMGRRSSADTLDGRSEAGLVGAVGFDLGDTLVGYEGVPLNWQREYPVALAALCAAFSEQVSDDQLASGIRVLQRYNTRVTLGTHEVDDRLVFGELFRALGLRSGLPQDDFNCGVDAFFSVFRGRARVVPGDQVARLVDLGHLGPAVHRCRLLLREHAQGRGESHFGAVGRATMRWHAPRLCRCIAMYRYCDAPACVCVQGRVAYTAGKQQPKGTMG